MLCNATNTNPEFFGQNIVPNTDGIDTYRSTNVQLLNWDITCGDDCLAIKGNTTNLLADNITCRGGDGVAFGSLGQYYNLIDNVDNVTISNVLVTRINSSIQPLMHSGLYMKAWTGAINGVPPVNGGGGSGTVSNARFINFTVEDPDFPTLIDQTYGGNSTDNPSKMQFINITWENWSGTAANSTVVDLECSSTAPCENLAFLEFNITVPSGDTPDFECSNSVNVTGISC
ncbi:unnamed protein product [Peniophora sp. CBMAI 1063]|nr:unnamed protein product [Peniophora sp. CBMAI 1063]